MKITLGGQVVTTSVYLAASASLSSTLISWMERQNGWRLGATLATVTGADVIVSAMNWLLKGEVTLDYLLTGLAAAGCIAPVSLALFTHLLEDCGRA